MQVWHASPAETWVLTGELGVYILHGIFIFELSHKTPGSSVRPLLSQAQCTTEVQSVLAAMVQEKGAVTVTKPQTSMCQPIFTLNHKALVGGIN